MAHHFISRADLLPDGETVESHKTMMAEETELIAKHRESNNGMFDGVFSKKEPVQKWSFDPEDGVMRCNTCHWEIEDGWCQCPRDDLDTNDDTNDEEDMISENDHEHESDDIVGIPTPGSREAAVFDQFIEASYNIEQTQPRRSHFQPASRLLTRTGSAISATASSSVDDEPFPLVDIEADVSGSDDNDSEGEEEDEDEDEDEDEEETSSMRDFVAPDDEDEDQGEDDEDEDGDDENEGDGSSVPGPYRRVHHFGDRNARVVDRGRRSVRLVDSESDEDENVFPSSHGRGEAAAASFTALAREYSDNDSAEVSASDPNELTSADYDTDEVRPRPKFDRRRMMVSLGLRPRDSSDDENEYNDDGRAQLAPAKSGDDDDGDGGEEDGNRGGDCIDSVDGDTSVDEDEDDGDGDNDDEDEDDGFGRGLDSNIGSRGSLFRLPGRSDDRVVRAVHTRFSSPEPEDDDEDGYTE